MKFERIKFSKRKIKRERTRKINGKKTKNEINLFEQTLYLSDTAIHALE